MKRISLLFRDRQLELLRSLLCAASPTAVVHCYGHRSSGKSSTLSEALQTARLSKQIRFRYVTVNCAEVCSSVKLLFQDILDGLAGSSVVGASDNVGDFVLQLLRLTEEQRWDNVAIVLDKAERLLHFPTHVLATLLRLHQLVDRRITVITVSVLPWINFSTTGFLVAPIQIAFPSYSKEMLVDLLRESKPSGPDHLLHHFDEYARLVVDTVFSVSRDIKELKYLAHVNWPKVVAAIDEEGDGDGATPSLWRSMRPLLQSSHDDLFFHMDNAADSGADGQTLDLPKFSKYLLVAAYCASYNPVTSDRRFFLKNHGKQRRHWSMEAASAKNSAHQAGPKVFPFDRLMFIFLQIVDNKQFASKLNLATQVATLTSMGLLSQASANGNLDAPKYRCMATLDTVQRVAKQIDFDLMSHLFDFASR